MSEESVVEDANEVSSKRTPGALMLLQAVLLVISSLLPLILIWGNTNKTVKITISNPTALYLQVGIYLAMAIPIFAMGIALIRGSQRARIPAIVLEVVLVILYVITMIMTHNIAGGVYGLVALGIAILLALP